MDSLGDVQALVFDVFGTTVDWHGSVIKELETLGERHNTDGNWSDFAKTWRSGYFDQMSGGTGLLSMDDMHYEILENILSSTEWKHFGALLNENERKALNNVWHHLQGWPDATSALNALKKHTIIAALSNGNIRLLVDLAKHADLPWDVVLSSELFSSYKPDAKVYQGAMKHLSLEPKNCAMVAAHVWDLRGAARTGMKTIYVRRAAEEPVDEEEVQPKSKGGEVDLVVDSFIELVALFVN
ncbi:haloacid dehalogenase [Mycena crocata]|nr:haloacid dehalogenase [Mycena crocata]